MASSNYLRSFEYFRAVTILIIVAGHCYGIAGWKIETFSDRVLANLLSGGTSLFVFISGFLFHHVFYPRYDYVTFVKNKVKNVYIPYLFLSIIPVVLAIYSRNPYPEFYFGPDDTFFDQIIRPFFLYYWHGGVMVYWYIPFIMAIFLISPLFVFFIKQSFNFRISAVVFLSLISVFVHRPVNNLSIFQSVIYFIPVYIFGILCSMERDFLYRVFNAKDHYIFCIVLALAVLQAAVMDTCGNLQKDIFDFNGVDISFFQKMVMCVFFMIYLRRFDGEDFKILQRIASASFSIYFLHGWFVFIIWMFYGYYQEYSGLYLLPVFSALVVWISYSFAVRVRKAFPNKSRMLIGW